MDDKKEKEFIEFCKTKLWGLHTEEVQWQKKYKKELDEFRAKQAEIIKTKEDKWALEQIHIWTQQLGKIIFISAILKEFFDSPEIPDKVWKERKVKPSDW